MCFLSLPVLTVLTVLCLLLTSSEGCNKMPIVIPQTDLFQIEANALADVGVEEGDARAMINKLLAEGISQLFASDEVNFEGFKQKTAELLSNPEFIALMEKTSSLDGGDCGCGSVESDSCDIGNGVETTSCSIGDSCSSLK